jgi:hypothetical protein
MEQQLLLFEESPIDKIKREIANSQKRHEMLRKSMHARIGAQDKQIDDLNYELNQLKLAIIRNSKLYSEGFV